MPQDKEKKIDRRVVQTKLALRESLLTLLQEKPLHKITPSELCRKAKLNRNTFYAHYHSPEHLLHTIEDELYQEVFAAIKKQESDKSSLKLLTTMIEILAKNRSLCMALFSNYNHQDILFRMIQLIRETIIQEWKSSGMNLTNSQANILYTYFSNGSMAVIQKWALDGMKKSPNELAHFIGATIRFGLKQYM